MNIYTRSTDYSPVDLSSLTEDSLLYAFVGYSTHFTGNTYYIHIYYYYHIYTEGTMSFQY